MKNIKVIAHIKSWGEHGFVTALSEIPSIGFDGFEADSSIVDLYEDRVEVFQEILRQNQVSLAAVSVWARFYTPPLIEEDIEHILNCIRFASANGAKVVILTLGSTRLPPDFKIDWKAVINGISDAGARSAKFGVKLAIAPALGTFIQTPKDVEMVAKKTPAKYVGVALDAALFSLLKADAPAFISKNSARLSHVYFRDIHVPKAKKPVGSLQMPRVYPVGRGDAPLKKIAAALKRSRKFSGIISVYLDEPEKDSPTHEAQLSYDYMKKVLGLV